MSLKARILQMCRATRTAARNFSSVSADSKNRALKNMAAALLKNKAVILRANSKDLSFAGKIGSTEPFLDRLRLNDSRIREMAESLLALVNLNDPVGELIKAWRRPNGLWIHKVRVPLGVIAIIYESRPNVTADCIGLALKSGNAVILRGGSEALHSNLAIYQILKSAAVASGISGDVIQIVRTKERLAIDELLKLSDYIDLVIPRGGEGLIRRVVAKSRIPVIKHYKGICHTYVDQWADLNMAGNICVNAKTQRPATCNAMETLLVHKNCALRFLPVIAGDLSALGVKIRGCARTLKILKGSKVIKASEKDYHSEYLDLILNIKIVEDITEAIAHINEYGSHHSDSIVTANYDAALGFLQGIDSACVYVNASTRFSDGYQFGMGAEIGISTDKLHARGPMALEELTTYKYIVFGNGQIRN